MKILKVICISFCFSHLFSCVSTYKKLEGDYYQVINIALKKRLEQQDSLFLPMPYSTKEFKKRKKKKKISHLLKIIDFSEPRDDGAIDFLRKEANIDVKEEMSYFKKQIKQYQAFDTTKFSVKKIKYLPRPKNLKDTLKYMDYKYTKYSFGFSRPVFTRNGNYALIAYYGKSGGWFISVYRKVNYKWEEYAKYLILKT